MRPLARWVRCQPYLFSDDPCQLPLDVLGIRAFGEQGYETICVRQVLVLHVVRDSDRIPRVQEVVQGCHCMLVRTMPASDRTDQAARMDDEQVDVAVAAQVSRELTGCAQDFDQIPSRPQRLQARDCGIPIADASTTSDELIECGDQPLFVLSRDVRQFPRQRPELRGLL